LPGGPGVAMPDLWHEADDAAVRGLGR